MRIFIFCCTYLLLSLQGFTNAEPICSAQGICEGNLVSTLEDIPYKQKCVQECQRHPDCQWFSHNLSSSTCFLFSDCPTLDESCLECTSGESSCKGGYSKLLVVGGSTMTEPWDRVEIIDLENNNSSCKNLPDFPFQLYGAIGGLTFGEKPLVCGGFPYNNLCYIFEDGAWVRTHDMLVTRGTAGFIRLTDRDQSLIVTGGSNANYTHVNTAEVLTKSGWVEMPSLPSTLAFHCMAYKDDETIMVVGGIENNFCCSDSTYILDAESQTWIEGPKLLEGRSDVVCGRIRSSADSEDFSVIVPGGYNGALSSVEILEQNSDKWKYGPELPIPIYRAALVEEPSGGIIVIGGDTTDSNFLTSLYWLPHAEAEWQELPQKLAYGRDLLTAFLVPDEITDCS